MKWILGLLAIGALARVKPHRIFFLIDSLWFVLLAGNTIFEIFTGSSWLWSVLVVLQLLLAKSGIMQYQRFRDIAPEQSA